MLICDLSYDVNIIISTVLVRSGFPGWDPQWIYMAHSAEMHAHPKGAGSLTRPQARPSSPKNGLWKRGVARMNIIDIDRYC